LRITEHLYLIGSGAHGISHRGDCHVYLVDAGPSLLFIDAGCGEDTGRLVDNLAADGLDPAAVSHILVTHAHRDHAGGAASLSFALPGPVAVTASEAEAELLETGSEKDVGLGAIGLGGRTRAEVFPVSRVQRRVRDGEVLEIGRLRIRTIIVPGHNPGCSCWLMELDGRRMLFAGDVIFCGGYISVGNWPTCDPRAYRESLPRLAGLGIDALLSGHHLWTLAGGQSHIDRAIGDFQRLWPPPGINEVRG